LAVAISGGQGTANQAGTTSVQVTAVPRYSYYQSMMSRYTAAPDR
jgi:hypothetical protein